MSAAEKLFAARGVDRVSLREINRASGARNAVALQYHFGDRDGIVGRSSASTIDRWTGNDTRCSTPTRPGRMMTSAS